MKKLYSSTIFKLIIAVIIGILLGFIANEGFMNIVVTVKYILGQLIFFMVPLIILGFVSYSIAKMKDNASKMLSLALVIAYLSSIGAACRQRDDSPCTCHHDRPRHRVDQIGSIRKPAGQFSKNGVITHQPDSYTHSPLLHRSQFLCIKLRGCDHETTTRVPWRYGYCHHLPVRVAFFLVRPCRSRLEKKSLAGIEVLRPRLPHGCRHDVIRCHVSRCVKMCQEKSSIKRRCY